jgi:hypothetical protein
MVMNMDTRLQRNPVVGQRRQQLVHAAHFGLVFRQGVMRIAGRLGNCVEGWSGEAAGLALRGRRVKVRPLPVPPASVEAPAATLVVSVTAGEVRLSGSVAGWAERDQALLSAWRTPGVRRVVDTTHMGN